MAAAETIEWSKVRLALSGVLDLLSLRREQRNAELRAVCMINAQLDLICAIRQEYGRPTARERRNVWASKFAKCIYRMDYMLRELGVSPTLYLRIHAEFCAGELLPNKLGNIEAFEAYSRYMEKFRSRYFLPGDLSAKLDVLRGESISADKLFQAYLLAREYLDRMTSAKIDKDLLIAIEADNLPSCYLFAERQHYSDNFLPQSVSARLEQFCKLHSAPVLAKFLELVRKVEA